MPRSLYDTAVAIILGRSLEMIGISARYSIAWPSGIWLAQVKVGGLVAHDGKADGVDGQRCQCFGFCVVHRNMEGTKPYHGRTYEV